ncbi:MAG: branched-chain amino acid ABC transporter permease [Alphaproteobacteria bacterium]|nr:branched-chain amino acid ABC transporter permease [Alphaproteobacteria bacterium]
MLYREAGQFKASYAADQAIFPITQDRVAVIAVLLIAYLGVPFIQGDYWFEAILLPLLIFALAAIGLNILTGYCGQISLGTGGFLAVGAYSTYKLMTAFPDLNILLIFILAGLITAGVGILFGLPSLRIKGFYLAVATLAAQFFLVWLFNKVPWFYNYHPSGNIEAPPREAFGFLITGAEATPQVRYVVILIFVTLLTLAAKNLVRGRIGRSWMAIRDMDIAAEIIGIRPLQTKLLAFAISSFYIGVAGAMMFSMWLGSVETEAFQLFVSFDVLFMIIIGGLGSLLGSFLGAGFILLLPIVLTNLFVGGLGFTANFAKHVEFMLFGGLIIFFLIVEPHGLARLWQITKEKLRLWPFPH